MRIFFSVILILSVLSGPQFFYFQILCDSEVAELMDIDDNDLEEKKREFENKIFIEDTDDVVNCIIDNKRKMFSKEQENKTLRHNEILTPPPKLV